MATIGGPSPETGAQPAPGAARALVLADRPVLAQAVCLALNHGLYLARTARTAAAAEALLGAWRPHLAVVDIDIADGDVLDWLAHGPAPSPVGRIPLVALTRRGDLKTKLAAFERGVDDILTVPFSPEELVARVIAIMRRAYRDPLTFAPVVRVGELEIDILNHHVRAGEAALRLTSQEESLLYLLAANAGRVLSRDEILDHLWGVDFVAESNLVDRHVHNLRVKLHDDHRRPRYIATVPGRGYRFLPIAGDEDRGAS